MYWLIKNTIFCFNLLPLGLRISTFSLILKSLGSLIKDLKRTALINLQIALPEKSSKEHHLILNKSYQVWGRCLVDVLRQKNLSDQWILDNIECPELEQLKEFKKKYPDIPYLILTGHIGSFEFILRYLCVQFGPIAFVARKLKPDALDQWWNEQRSRGGNQLIPRKGAIRKIFKFISEKIDVAILFDQNVVKSQGIFIKWFGRYAATTPAVGLVAAKYKLPVIVFSMNSIPGGKYRLNFKIEELLEIHQDTELGMTEKIYKITDICAQDLQKLILDAPEEWFWFHRRWKTAVLAGEGEKLYKD